MGTTAKNQVRFAPHFMHSCSLMSCGTVGVGSEALVWDTKSDDGAIYKGFCWQKADATFETVSDTSVCILQGYDFVTLALHIAFLGGAFALLFSATVSSAHGARGSSL